MPTVSCPEKARPRASGSPEARKLEALGRAISKKAGSAIADYKMIEDGDKIVVAVSGGKDSLTLLKVLSDRRSFVPVRYDIVAVHVDMGYTCVNKETLKNYMAQKGYPFCVKKWDILQGRPRSEITCFWCSWNRRKALFEAAREHGCNKLALGHHKDDIVQTILMNLLFEGKISAMAPHQKMSKWDFSIIRPLAYVEEQEIEAYAASMDFPLPHCACPNADTSQRTQVRRFINELHETCPTVKTNIFKSLQRIRRDYLL